MPALSSRLDCTLFLLQHVHPLVPFRNMTCVLTLPTSSWSQQKYLFSIKLKFREKLFVSNSLNDLFGIKKFFVVIVVSKGF